MAWEIRWLPLPLLSSHCPAGFANEAVPLNDEHYYLPLWQVGLAWR